MIMNPFYARLFYDCDMFSPRNLLRLSITIAKFGRPKRKVSEQLDIRSEIVHYKELESNYDEIRYLL